MRCANPVLLEVLPEFKSAQERADMIVEKCLLTFDSLPFIPAEPYNVIRTDYKARRGRGRRMGWQGHGVGGRKVEGPAVGPSAAALGLLLSVRSLLPLFLLPLQTYALVQGAKDRSFVQAGAWAAHCLCWELARAGAGARWPPAGAQLESPGPRAACPAPQIYSRTPNPGPEFIAEKKAVLAELGYPADEIRDTPQAGREGPLAVPEAFFWKTKPAPCLQQAQQPAPRPPLPTRPAPAGLS